MQNRVQLPRWTYHVFVAVAFCAVYQLVRSVSMSYWSLQAGLRLACVLLLPRRYWLALIAGDMLAGAPVAYQCLKTVGWAASVAHLFPAIVFAMPPVCLLQDHLPGAASGKRILRPMTAGGMVALMVCVAVLALGTTLDGTIQLYLQVTDSGDATPKSVWACRYLLGHSIGALTVVPLVLAIYEAVRHSDSWALLGQRIARSRLLLEGLVVGIGCLVLLTLLGAGIAGDTLRQVARLAMFAPVAWMAVRYGWQGAAVGGTAASVGILLTMPAKYDPATLLAQAIMVVIMAFLLPLGARIGALNDQDRRMGQDHRETKHAARRELYQSELRLREGLQSMGGAYGIIEDAFGKLLQKWRNFLPDPDERHYRRQLMLAKHEMFWRTNSQHPVQWDRRGLPSALWDGPIAQTLHESDIEYTARVPADLRALTPDTQLSVYRLACESVAYLLDQSPRGVGSIHLSVRLFMVGRGHEIPWVVLVAENRGMTAAASTDLLVSPAALLPPREHMLAKLGAMGLRAEGMRDRASLYDGQVRIDGNLQRVTISLLDTPITPSHNYR